jgi:hypothetical protein
LPVAFDLWSRLVGNSIFLGMITYGLWRLSTLVLNELILWDYPHDFPLLLNRDGSVMKKRPRPFLSAFVIVLFSLAFGAILARLVRWQLRQLQSEHVSVEAVHDAPLYALFAPLVAVVLIVTISEILYANGRADLFDADEPSSQVRLLGTDYAKQWNRLMMAHAQHRLGIGYWIATLIGSVVWNVVVTPEVQQRLLLPEGVPSPPDAWKYYTGIVAFIATFIALLLLWLVASPHTLLVRGYFKRLRDLEKGEPSVRSTINFRASRWRTFHHRHGFLIASRLERCLGATLRRLEPRDAAIVTSTYFRLASALRRSGIRISSNSTRSDQFDRLILASYTLLLSGNPVTAAQAITYLVADEPEPSPPAVGRLRKMTDSVSDGIQRHERTLKSVGFIAIVLFLFLTGKLARLGELFAK